MELPLDRCPEEVRMNMPSDSAPEQPDSAPILPAQSREDTDVGWGDFTERDDDDRLLRDRPPHWDDV
jgi:hypothetical protein